MSLLWSNEKGKPIEKSNCGKEKSLRRTQQNSTPLLNDGFTLLPFTHQSAGGIRRNVGSVGQILIRDFDLDSARDTFSNGAR